MALVLADRVRETSTSIGTGTIALAGAFPGFQSFAVGVGTGNTTYYTIANIALGEWEVGLGTYTTSGSTLTRATVFSSSTGSSLVNFSAGTKDVFVTQPAGRAVYLDASGNASALGTPTAFVGTNITGTAAGLTAGNTTTNANLTGGVTSVGNAATVVTNADLTGAVTSVGNAASLGSFTSAQLAGALTDETGSGASVFATSPTLTTPTISGALTYGGVTLTALVSGTGRMVLGTGPTLSIPNLGTPTLLVGTNITGTAAAFNINGTVGATTPAAGTFTAVTASSDSTFSSTGAITVSKGTTAQQPASPVSGMFRFNTTTAAFEGYNGTTFASIGGGASGGGTDAALYENDLLGTANYTIGQGALVSGATITIASPAVVTLANTFTAGQPVRFTTTGALPTGLSTTAAYYVISAGLTTSAFQVSLTSGGVAVNTSGSQSGVHSAGKIKNASTVGPFVVASGVAYTVPSGSRWVVL